MWKMGAVFVSFCLVIVGICSCGLFVEGKPTPEELRQTFRFLSTETEVRGLYTNYDVGAVIFKFRPASGGAEASTGIEALLQAARKTGWSLTQRSYVLHREGDTPTGTYEEVIRIEGPVEPGGWFCAGYMKSGSAAERRFGRRYFWPKFSAICESNRPNREEATSAQGTY